VEDRRFVVRIEVVAQPDPERLDETEWEEDALESIAEMIRRQEALRLVADPATQQAQADAQDEEQTRGFRYDLCPACRAQFIADPLGLGRRNARKLDFSSN